jgi:hypothetical protein
MTVLLALFLAVHGVLHLAVWLPHPTPDPAKPPPFNPDHSAVLTAVAVPPSTATSVAHGLAGTAALTYVLAAIGAVAHTDWVVGMAACAAAVGLILKALFFNPWLVVGIALDVAVLAAALTEWPVSLT